MSDTRQNTMLTLLLWRLWVSRNASYYPLHKPASSWFSLGFFHSFSLTFQTKFQVRSHDIYCTTFPHINFVVWHSGRMRTNFDARSSREEQPSCNFKFINFVSFSLKGKDFLGNPTDKQVGFFKSTVINEGWFRKSHRTNELIMWF